MLYACEIRNQLSKRGASKPVFLHYDLYVSLTRAGTESLNRKITS